RAAADRRSCGLLGLTRNGRLAQPPLLVEGQPAAVEVAPGVDAVLERRLLLALLEGVRAARAELAAPREVDQRRRRALDRVQALGLRPVEPRDRAEQAPRVRVLRVVEDVALPAVLDHAARVHDEDLVRHLGDDA